MGPWERDKNYLVGGHAPEDPTDFSLETGWGIECVFGALQTMIIN